METRYMDADLLIIGGGSAGCVAAIRALELNPDLKVVIFEKGDIKYSGCIARGMDAMNIVVIPNFTSPELYVEAVTLSCKGIVDAPASYVMAQRSYEFCKKMERWGVYFPKDENGKYHTVQFHPKGEFLVSMEEPNLKVIIAKMAQDKGAFVVNRTMGHRLLMDDGRVAGAVGLNVRSGELVCCRANAVIITAGGQARFSLPNSGYLYNTFDYPGNTGDGYVMAFEAGASLTGMEYGRSTVLIKDLNCPLLAITIPRGSKVYDVLDNLVLEKYAHESEVMSKAHNEGRGPLRMRMSHLPREKIEEIEHILFTTERPVQERWFKRRGIDFRKHDIELYPTEVQLCGGHGMAGVRVNENAECGVPGLYVAGDAASVPKQHLTGAFVFGEIAAEQAVEFIASESKTKLDLRQVRVAETLRNQRYTTAGREIPIRELEYKVRRIIGEYVISPKSEYKLNRWLEWAQVFQKEIENEALIQNGHELSKLYEIENIVKCATFSAKASLERKESRWGNCHYRIDYPDTDDRNWLCHVVLQKGENANDIRVSKQPVLGMKGGNR